MWDASLYLEYASRERMRDLVSQAQNASPETALRTSRACGVRRHLARRLVSLGLYLDPQADRSVSPRGRSRLGSR